MVSKKRRALDKLKQDWYILNRQQQQAKRRVAEEHTLYHKHSCFTRTSSGNITSETEFFVAEHLPSSVASHPASHPPSGADTTMEDFGFDSYGHTDIDSLVDYDTVDPAYENFLKESTVGPKKRLRPTGV